MEKTENIKKERESNIELYRIVLMLLIIAHHYVVNSGVLNLMYEQPLLPKSIFLFIFGAWGKIGINCFLLITGYYMCKSKITLKKFLKLLLEVEFYKIIIYIIFIITGFESFNIKGVIKVILPVTSIAQNFTGCFLVFYLLIPYINVLINNLDEKQHLKLIGILIVVYSILGNIPSFNIVMNYITLYFIIYLIGSYIRIYPKKIFENKKMITIVLIESILLCIISIFVCLIIGNRFNKQMAYFFVNDSNKILAIITAVAMFLWFKNLKVEKNKFINTIASSIFGVLLIHANSDTMRIILWNKILKNVDIYNYSNIIYLHAIISVLTIFIVAILIDQIRIKFIEKPFFRKFNNYIDKFDKI